MCSCFGFSVESDDLGADGSRGFVVLGRRLGEKQVGMEICFEIDMAQYGLDGITTGAGGILNQDK